MVCEFQGPKETLKEDWRRDVGGNLCPEPREQRRHGLTRGVQRLALLTEEVKSFAMVPALHRGWREEPLNTWFFREGPSERGQEAKGKAERAKRDLLRQRKSCHPDAMLGNMKHV